VLHIPCMDYARLETSTLKDVTDDYYYGCSCQSCLHTARLSLSKLRAHLGDEFPLRKIREVLRLAGPFGLLPSPGGGESEARLGLASRIRSPSAIESVVTSL